MNIDCIKKIIIPKLKNYKLTYNSFPNGDFGSLERINIEGINKVAGIDIWSKGWLNIDIYDLVLDEQVMNVLLGPEEIKEKEDAIVKLLGILLDEK
ncbi:MULTISPECIES: hypothetical protein [Snodgrassella]|jgi:hypothetical protein|uniref:hypothetical protein n=1 Tax=Snodgrassella TaxID=1193515 RepID=UPI000C1DF31C|nr:MULTISPECIES: hypothetical protein [Snodgrassella]MCO6527152.1 hypothetical protein [Snodgrassella sp.]PIT09081.1 hypothetical protein BGI31_04215 [Snodgrassella communis]